MLPQLPADIQPAQPRQHQIQHHQGKWLAIGRPLQHLQGVAAIATGLDAEALQLQGFADRFANRFVVFDYEQGRLHVAILAGQLNPPESCFNHSGNPGREPW